MSKFVILFTKITGFIPQFLYYRRKAYYINKKEQSKKIKGPAIIVSNHTSVFDYPLYMFTFFRRTIRPLIAEIMFEKGKLFAWFLRKLGGIRVDRVNYDFSFVYDVLEILNNNGVVLIFPESRLPLPTENELLEFKPSYIYLALESDVPIIPVYTNGSYGKKKRANIIIGEKIYLKELLDEQKSEKENIEYLSNYVRNYIKFLGARLNEINKKKEQKNS